MSAQITHGVRPVESAEKHVEDEGLSHPKTLIVFSPAWPGMTSGYGLAIRSSLAVLQTTEFEIHFVALCADPALPEMAADFPSVRFTHIPIAHESKFKRLIRSLGSRHPATVIRFVSANAGERISAYLRQHVDPKRECRVLFEDIGCSVHLERIASHLPDALFAARLHNVLSTSFFGLRDQSNPLVKAAWDVEIERIRRFETEQLQKLTRAWTITADDELACQRVLGSSLDGVISVVVEAERYSRITDSDDSTVVWLGTADARKRAGISAFLDHAWPEVLRSVPTARLVLAGRGTDQFNDPMAQVEGLGSVADDRTVLRRGRVFVNPQESGSGIKVKSLVAMAAGRALVSTPVGTEGIPGVTGKHFVVNAKPKDMADSIVDLLNHRRKAHEMGEAARRFVTERFSREAFYQTTMPLLSDFLSSKTLVPTSDLKHDQSLRASDRERSVLTG